MQEVAAKRDRKINQRLESEYEKKTRVRDLLWLLAVASFVAMDDRLGTSCTVVS